MAEYIEREAIFRAYMDLCLAKSKLEKARKGGAFFRSDLLPETEISEKEWVRLIMAAPTTDVSPLRHGRWGVEVGMNFFKERNCPVCKKRIESNFWNFCPNCGAKMDLEG